MDLAQTVRNFEITPFEVVGSGTPGDPRRSSFTSGRPGALVFFWQAPQGRVFLVRTQAPWAIELLQRAVGATPVDGRFGDLTRNAVVASARRDGVNFPDNEPALAPLLSYALSKTFFGGQGTVGLPGVVEYPNIARPTRATGTSTYLAMYDIAEGRYVAVVPQRDPATGLTVYRPAGSDQPPPTEVTPPPPVGGGTTTTGGGTTTTGGGTTTTGGGTTTTGGGTTTTGGGTTGVFLDGRPTSSTAGGGTTTTGGGTTTTGGCPPGSIWSDGGCKTATGLPVPGVPQPPAPPGLGVPESVLVPQGTFTPIPDTGYHWAIPSTYQSQAQNRHAALIGAATVGLLGFCAGLYAVGKASPRDRAPTPPREPGLRDTRPSWREEAEGWG